MRSFIILLFCFFFSCKSQNKFESQMKYEGYVDENFKNYSHIYDQINLWIDESKALKRENLKSLIFEPNYSIDKLVLINKEKNKLVGTVNVSDSIFKNVTHDIVFMFWGVKISNKWNFIRGGTLYVPRKNYKYNIYEALSHFQLSYIGRDYFLKHFLIVDSKKIRVDSEVLNNHVALKSKHHQKYDDVTKNWIYHIEDSNSKIVPQKEIDDIWESIKNEVKEDHILPEKGTKAWKELYGGKTPLFEREEWKNYEAQLNK